MSNTFDRFVYGNKIIVNKENKTAFQLKDEYSNIVTFIKGDNIFFIESHGHVCSSKLMDYDIEDEKIVVEDGYITFINNCIFVGRMD